MSSSKKQMEREIDQIARGGSALYYPGGSGGGGSRRGRGASGAVVLPHARTSKSCSLCTRYHTTAEHNRHSESKAKAKAKTKAKAKAKTKTKKTKVRAKAMTGTTRRESPSALARKTERIAAQIRDALPTVLSAVKSMPSSGRFGPGDVFISAVYDKVGKKIGMTMDQFKRWLVIQNRKQNLSLHRADMVDAMDQRKVDRSEINDLGAQFHFIDDRSV